VDTHSTCNHRYYITHPVSMLAKFAARAGMTRAPRTCGRSVGPFVHFRAKGFHLAERASGRLDMYTNWGNYSLLTVISLWIAPQFLNSDGRVSTGKYIQHPLIVFNSVRGMFTHRFTYFILLFLARKVTLVCLL